MNSLLGRGNKANTPGRHVAPMPWTFFRWAACFGSCAPFLRRGLVGWSKKLELDAFGMVLRNKICVSCRCFLGYLHSLVTEQG